MAQLHEKYAELSDDELMNIAADDGENYVPEAIDAARNVLRRRGLKPPAPVQPEIEDLEEQQRALLAGASNDKIAGVLWFCGGVVASALSLYFSSGGGLVFTGAIFWGAWQYARGFRRSDDARRLGGRIRLRALEEGKAPARTGSR